MITSTILSKGQITIQKQIRELLKADTSNKIVFIPLKDGKEGDYADFTDYKQISYVPSDREPKLIRFY